MNLSESIEYLLDNGANDIVCGRTPDQKPYAKARQAIPTGPEGNHVILEHQVTGSSVVDCIEKIKRNVDYANEMGVREIKRNKSN